MVPTLSQVNNELWRRGITKQILRPKQAELRDFLLNTTSTTTVVNAHRQFGKSTSLFQYADEMARKNKNWIIKIGSSTNKQIQGILRVVQDTVLRSCPRALRPKFNKTDSEFTYPNGSVIKMIGVDIGMDRLRGTPSDLVILDEVGFFSDLDGLIKSVILPTFNERPHGKLILTSTPPEVLVHDFAQIYIPQAKANKAYWELPITKNPRFTTKDIEKFAEPYHVLNPLTSEIIKDGKTTEKFRREYLCEIIPDSERLVFPEWQMFKQPDHPNGTGHGLIFRDIKRPRHYVPFVVADFGFKDHTGIIFGWLDFTGTKIWNPEENLEKTSWPTLVCAREIWCNQTTPSAIAEQCLEVIKDVFPGKTIQEIQWYADADLGVLAEIQKQTKISFKSANGWIKQHKDGNITSTRTNIQHSRIVVDERCANLITQLDKGIWKENRSDWERNDVMGHCDLLAALIYYNKVMKWNHNPTPAPTYNEDNYWIKSPKVNNDDQDWNSFK